MMTRTADATASPGEPSAARSGAPAPSGLLARLPVRARALARGSTATSRQRARCLAGRGRPEAPLPESLREQTKTLPTPPQHFDQIAAAAAVDKQVAAERILGKMIL